VIKACPEKGITYLSISNFLKFITLTHMGQCNVEVILKL
jgi:hypothetical protein